MVYKTTKSKPFSGFRSKMAYSHEFALGYPAAHTSGLVAIVAKPTEPFLPFEDLNAHWN